MTEEVETPTYRPHLSGCIIGCLVSSAFWVALIAVIALVISLAK